MYVFLRTERRACVGGVSVYVIIHYDITKKKEEENGRKMSDKRVDEMEISSFKLLLFKSPRIKS